MRRKADSPRLLTRPWVLTALGVVLTALAVGALWLALALSTAEEDYVRAVAAILAVGGIVSLSAAIVRSSSLGKSSKVQWVLLALATLVVAAFSIAPGFCSGLGCWSTAGLPAPDYWPISVVVLLVAVVGTTWLLSGRSKESRA